MKLFCLEETPFEPISHDPQLKKRVLAREALPFVKQISHVILPPGSEVSAHLHSDNAEVFYCIRGVVVFLINQKSFSIKRGHLLIIEPGESHSIPEVIEETELLYFHTRIMKTNYS
jgi:mannose-6-phosphate isomerase-like protein (cupin superfamily)